MGVSVPLCVEALTMLAFGSVVWLGGPVTKNPVTSAKNKTMTKNGCD